MTGRTFPRRALPLRLFATALTLYPLDGRRSAVFGKPAGTSNRSLKRTEFAQASSPSAVWITR